MKKHPKDYFDLEGQVAIVTGGLGILGREYTKALLDAGAKVAIFDIAKKAHQDIDAFMHQSLSVRIYRIDITKKAQVKKGIQDVKRELGIPSILINNAGIDVTPRASAKENGPFEQYPEGAWDAIVDSHLKGAFLVSQEFLRMLRPSKKTGSIINVSSTYGVVSPDQSLYRFRRKRGENFYKPVAYSVAKSGMLNFTRWLAEYCARSGLGVRVNTFVPGGVYAGQDKKFVNEYGKRTILGRMARPDEYNGAVLFLASRASSYMTGATLIVDGGWTAR